MKNTKIELHLRQTNTHTYSIYTHTCSDPYHKDINDLFHYLSLFSWAVLTHNLELGSFSVHIKRLIEKQIRRKKKPCWDFSGTTFQYMHTQKITFTHIYTYDIHHGYANR